MKLVNDFINLITWLFLKKWIEEWKAGNGECFREMPQDASRDATLICKLYVVLLPNNIHPNVNFAADGKVIISKMQHIWKDIRENKDPGLWRTLEDPGPLKTQAFRESRTLEDPGP